MFVSFLFFTKTKAVLKNQNGGATRTVAVQSSLFVHVRLMSETPHKGAIQQTCLVNTITRFE